MHRRTIWVLVTAATLLMVMTVQAQQERRGRGGPGFSPFGISLSRIVANAEVQKEIAVTPEQRAKLREAVAAVRPAELNRESLRNLSEQERRAKFRELMEQRIAAARKLDEKLKGILSEKQLTRVREIRLQAMGIAGAVRDPEVVKALGITEEQTQKIRDAGREIMGQARQAGGRPDYAKLREQLAAKVKELLSDEQLAELKKMCGEPFDVSQLRASGAQRRRRSRN